MSKLDQQLIEDRQLRDASRAVLLSDIEHARTSFSAKGVADRVGGRIGDGAKDVLEVAKVHADDKRGLIAVLIGAIVLWLGREPLLEILGLTDVVLADDDDASIAPENGDIDNSDPESVVADTLNTETISPDDAADDANLNAADLPLGEDDEH